MKASQSGIGELLGTPCTVRRRLCAFLELPDIVNVCNASGIKIADTFSHSNGDMCTSLALTMQRHKYKDAAFMDKLRNFRTLEFLELHVPKQHPEKSQEPYKDLIRNNSQTLRTLKITSSRQLNGGYDTMFTMLSSACEGPFRCLQELEVPAEMLPPVVLGRLSNLRKLTLTGINPAASAQALSCAFACLDKLEVLHTISHPSILRALNDLHDNDLGKWQTLLVDDGTPFGNVLNLKHQFEFRLTTVDEDTAAESLFSAHSDSNITAQTPMDLPLSQPWTPQSRTANGDDFCSPPDFNADSSSVFSNNTTSPVTIVAEQITSPFGIDGAPRKAVSSSAARCSKLRLLRLEKFGNGPSFDSGVGRDLIMALQKFQTLYPEVEVECGSLYLVLREPEEPHSVPTDLIAKLTPKTAHLNIACLSPDVTLEDAIEQLSPVETTFAALESINLGVDRSVDGVCPKWLSLQNILPSVFRKKIDLKLSLPVCDGTLEALATSALFSRISGFTLHLSECYEQERFDEWLESFRRLTTSATALQNVGGLMLGGVREHQMALMCLSVIQSKIELKADDNTFSSLHNNTEGKLESPSPSFHTPINNLATQIRRCNINDVIDSPLIASPKLNGFTAPEFCELGRSSGFPIDEVDISPCAHCGGIDDVNNDDIRLNGLYFPQQRQDTLGGRNAPSLSERTEFPTTCPRVPSWNTLQLRLPVESLEWCLIFVDLNPQVKDIAFISTSSSLHPRTQTDDVRRVVGLLPKAMERRGFKLKQKREITTARDLACVGVTDGTATTVLLYSRTDQRATKTPVLQECEHPQQEIQSIDLVMESQEGRDGPELTSAEKIGTIPLVAFFKKIKALEFQLLNLLDLYAEEFLPLLTAKSKVRHAGNVLDRVNWFFRRTQLVRTTLVSSRELQNSVLQRLFPSTYAEAADWVNALLKSQPSGLIDNSEGGTDGCSACKVDFDWLTRRGTTFPPFSSRFRWLLDTYKNLAQSYDAMITVDPNFESALQLPAYIMSQGSSIPIVSKTYFEWIFTTLLRGYQLNTACISRSGKPSRMFLQNVSKDGATKWCAEQLIKHHDLVASLLQRGKKSEGVPGMRGRFYTTRVSTGRVPSRSQESRNESQADSEPQPNSDCWIDVDFSIPSDFKSDDEMQHDVEWLERRNCTGRSAYQAVLKTVEGAGPSIKPQPKKEQYTADTFDEPPCPTQMWRPRDIPKHAPFVAKVHGLDPRMSEEDVYNIFAPSLKPYDLKIIPSDSTELPEALVEFGSRSHLGRALLYFHASECSFTPRWPTTASPCLLKIFLSLPRRLESAPVSTDEEQVL
eukprot:Selendium_serpulae@DN6371_c1_g1_i11.p1